MKELMEAAKKMLLHDEGLRLELYKCPANKDTIGIGRNVEDRGLSPQEQQRLFGVTGLNKMECVEMLRTRKITEALNC